MSNLGFLFLLMVVFFIAWLGPSILVARLAGAASGSFDGRFLKALVWWPLGLIWSVFHQEEPD